MILEEETKEAFGYYPCELNPHSHKSILAACGFCGEHKVTTKKDYRYFCNSCSAILGEKQKGMHPSEKTKTLMSKNHADFKGKKHPQWKGGLTKCTCLVCGKDFEVKPSTVKKGNGKYCSYSCAAKAKLHNARHTMTAPEKRFEIICKKHNLPFHFVGDGSLWLGNANPDFMHTTQKIEKWN